MITLKKLVPPENFNLFTRVPELQHIWEIPALQSDAREGYESYGRRDFANEDPGEIFTINDESGIVGVIGWFRLFNSFDMLRLWYHGIVPSKRGRGYGAEAVKQLLEYLAVHAAPEHVFIAESVTLSRAKTPQIIAHFKKMGFEEFDDPTYGENAGCGKTQSLCIRIPGR
jgi:hypothetical protein